MEFFVQDLRHAFRNLARQPGFAITAVLMLALGIGATTAIFSVVNAIVLRPLPLREPDRVAAVMTLWTNTGQRGATASAPDFYDWHDQNRSFSALSSFAGGETSVSVDGVADYAAVYATTPGFFEVLGAGAQAGRLPSASEEAPGGNLTAVITDAFWRRRFGGDGRALGTTVRFRGGVYTIVGILPPRVSYPAGAEIYTPAWPLGVTREAAAHRSAHNFRVIGRLRPGVTLEQANAEMVGIARRLEQAYPNSNANKSVVLVPLQESLVGDSRQTLYVLLAAVVFVLLIACANVANLLLARASVREREMVVRAAVGAGRGRLVRQLLTESIALAVVSGLAGALLARLGVAALVALAPPDLPRLDEITVDTTALGFALAISLASSVFFGLAPALQVSRVQLIEGLRQGGKGSALGARGGWARNAFVVAEIALAVVLVVGAALLGRSLVALAEVDLGFSAERLLVVRTSVPVSGMEDSPRATAFYRDVLPELRAIPGVTAVGAVTSLPTAVRSNGGYWIEGGPGPNDTGVRAPQAIFNVVTPEYFRAMRISLKSGRDFSDGDRRDAPFVVIVNEALVREAFPGIDPIGRRIQCGLDTLEFMTIVGVVADVRTRGPARPVQPEIYMPYEQHPAPASAMTIVARTAVEDPLAVAETMRRKIRERNPDVPAAAQTMEMTLETASATPRFRTFLLALFAAAALLLALSGVYGVMAYTVSRRIPEIGLRVALGAAPGDILRMIVGQGAKLAGIGLVIGVMLALAASRVIEGLLFGVTARDPVIFAAVAVLTAAAALGACYVPGRRAVRVEPMIALRSE
jgi:putative ABC transport system permease protein